MDNNIKGLILDIDGVIWRNQVPIGDPCTIFERIIEIGLDYTFATNNSTRTRAAYQSLLSKLGISVTEEQIVTSATLAAETLSQEYPDGGEVYIIGMEGLIEALSEAGFTHSSTAPLAVVTGLDTNFNYAQLTTAADLVRSGVPFFGTNPDQTLPTQTGSQPGTGSLLAAIEAASGKTPIVLGKPQPAMFMSALKKMALDPHNAIAIGDRLDTDIAGGQAAKCKTGLVLSGVASAQQARAWKPRIDIIAEDLSALVEEIAGD